MSSRLARQVLSTSARVSKRRVNINGPHQGCRRNMSASSHGSGEPKLTSDRPWILGAALIAGPLFFYELSKTPGTTAHHHAGTKYEPHAHPAMPMTDDEGTEADVGGSVAAAETADAPKAAAPSAAPEEGKTPNDDKTPSKPKEAKPPGDGKTPSNPKEGKTPNDMKTPSNPQEGADKEGADKSAEEPKDSSSDEAAPDSAELKED